VTAAGVTVLVAEDEPLASMALRAQLEALGYRVTGPARDGEEAIALGRCFPVDVAIFDFRMPRMNGLDAAQRLFEAAPTPVVLLSGFDSRYLPDRIPRPPIFASLTKPAELKDLRAALGTALEAFEQWLAAEPDRRSRQGRLREERTVIGHAVSALSGDGSHARTASRLLAQAAAQNRPLVELARDLAADAGPHG
jgi:two-component system, response regulator PdtaR